MQKSERKAACWDIFSDEDVTINPGEFQTVATGLVTDMYGCHALVLDKSGLASKLRVTRRAGVIDETYPEEWGVVMVNEGREPFIIKKGDKIAQVLFVPEFYIPVFPETEFADVVILDQVRTSGFGSTGAK